MDAVTPTDHGETEKSESKTGNLLSTVAWSFAISLHLISLLSTTANPCDIFLGKPGAKSIDAYVDATQIVPVASTTPLLLATERLVGGADCGNEIYSATRWDAARLKYSNCGKTERP